MKLFIFRFQISKPYADWEKGFLDHGSAREQFGVEAVFHGRMASSDQVVVGLKADSQEVLDQLMEQEGAKIEATGHILDSTEVEVVEL